MDLTRVQFLNSSEEINSRANEYWTLVMDIARKNSLKRIVRCSQIMGRSETDDLSAAQIMCGGGGGGRRAEGRCFSGAAAGLGRLPLSSPPTPL